MYWDYLADEVELVYGNYVDRNEEFFVCPECEELIYKCDWRDKNYYIKNDYGRFQLCCPRCKSILVDKDEEEAVEWINNYKKGE